MDTELLMAIQFGIDEIQDEYVSLSADVGDPCAPYQ
jgi:hypothetical protein